MDGWIHLDTQLRHFRPTSLTRYPPAPPTPSRSLRPTQPPGRPMRCRVPARVGGYFFRPRNPPSLSRAAAPLRNSPTQKDQIVKLRCSRSQSEERHCCSWHPRLTGSIRSTMGNFTCEYPCRFYDEFKDSWEFSLHLNWRFQCRHAQCFLRMWFWRSDLSCRIMGYIHLPGIWTVVAVVKD